MQQEGENKLIRVAIRMFIAVSVICFGVFRHLYGLNEITGNLLESGMAGTSKMALIEVHAFTILELGFVIWTIFGSLRKPYLVFAGMMFIVYTASFGMALGNDSFPSSDLSAINGMMGFPLVLLMLGAVVYAVIKLKDIKQWMPGWFSMTLTGLLVMGYFIYYMPYFSEFRNEGNGYDVKYANWDYYWDLLPDQQPGFMGKDDYTICFFSTTCSHCNEAANRLGVYLEKYPSEDVLLIFFGQSADQAFWENDDVISDFLVRNNVDLPYLKMKDYEAISISDNMFPVMITLEGKQPTEIFVGGEVNAWAFDYLFAKN
jgi:hypothetical protein